MGKCPHIGYNPCYIHIGYNPCYIMDARDRLVAERDQWRELAGELAEAFADIRRLTDQDPAGRSPHSVIYEVSTLTTRPLAAYDALVRKTGGHK